MPLVALGVGLAPAIENPHLVSSLSAARKNREPFGRSELQKLSSSQSQSTGVTSFAQAKTGRFGQFGRLTGLYTYILPPTLSVHFLLLNRRSLSLDLP